MNEIELSIVIPALNEENSIGICVQKAINSIKRLGVNGEVVVADNGSTDRTAAIAKELGAIVVPVSEKGYGNAYLGGIQAARGRYLIIGDADDSYNFDEISPFYEKLKQGFEYVAGNRFQGKIEPGAMPFLHRHLGTPVLTFLINLFFDVGIGDVNCGMRGFSWEAFNKMQLRTGGMEFATEMTIKAGFNRLKIGEVPCNLYRDKRGRKPHLRTFRDGWRHLRFMLLMAPTWTFLVPGFLAFLLGFCGLVVLTTRDIFFPTALHFITQKHMISSSILLLAGFQILAMGLTANIFAESKNLTRSNVFFSWLNQWFGLEKGILSGLGIFLGGFCIFSYLFLSYYFGVFPLLNDAIRFDLAMYGMISVFLGIQAIFLSFLLSLFFLKVS